MRCASYENTNRMTCCISNRNVKTKRNDVIEMKFCDYYSQMSYAQFIEFEKQNDEHAQYELRNDDSK
jgi:hypothetical protein